MEKKNKYEIDMCNGPILSKMLIFALPLMCSSVLQLLFNAADVVVVGRYAGDNSLAAVGSTGSLINLLTNVFIGLSVGANVLVAHYYGAKQEKELSETVHTAMLLGAGGGVLLTLLGLLLARQVLVLMQSPPEVIGLAALYLRIYFFGMPAMMIYNFGSAVLRAVGDTRRPLYYLVVAGIINVILNLFFVIVLKMDVAGVALATVISQCISAVLVVRCMLKEEGGIRLDPAALRLSRDKVRRILRIGLPAGFQGVVFSLSNVVIQSSVNGFGNIVMAGSSAAANIEGFVYVAMNSFYQATLSFTGQNVGASRYERVRRILMTGQCCVVVTGVILGSLAVLFGNTLLGIYTSSPEVIQAGLSRLKLVAAPYVLCGMMEVMVGTLRGLGYSVMPMIVSMLGACGIRLLWVATVFQIERLHTIETVYWSYPISWLITFLAHVVCLLAVRRYFREKKGIRF